MTETMLKAWVCQVCGYVHFGPEPPEECPVCGAESSMFELEDVPAPALAAAAAQPLRIVIAGAGIAGVSAAEAVHQAAPQAEIILISEEADLPYYRLNLTRYLAGEIGPHQLELHPAAWYEDNCIELLRETQLSALDLLHKEVILHNERRIGFDRLILTTGSRPFVPPVSGAGLANVTSLRTRQDAERILACTAAQAGMNCLVIGGGLLGLETAGALANQGVQVSLLENQPWLLPRQLNRRAGELLGRHVQGLGIQLHTGARLKELRGEGAVQGALLEDGTLLPAGLVIFSAGVRANIRLAQEAGLEVKQGICVDAAMRTSNADVFAAGDAAEHEGMLYGTWAPSQSQGSVAGASAVGQPAAFRNIPRSNTLKVLGIDLFSIGRTAAQPGDRVIEDGDDHYACFFFEGSLLAGAILLGDASLSARVKKAVENQHDCSRLLEGEPSIENIFQYLQNI